MEILFDKIQLLEVNSIIEKYKEKKFEKIKATLVNDINQLKGKAIFIWSRSVFLISDEVVKIDDEKESFIKEELKRFKFRIWRFNIWI